MKVRSKRYQDLAKSYDGTKLYALNEAVELAKKNATAKYNETINIAVNLAVDPKKADEQVRGSMVLPNGTGKSVKVLVFASGDKAEEAKAAGAEFVGTTDMVEKITGGWLDFDATIATPDSMKFVGRLGKILGPRGMMPNPKLGTVTFDVADAVKKMKAGQIEYKTDKFGVIRTMIGKSDFEAGKLTENLKALLKVIIKAKPSHIGSRSLYIKTIALAPTHGPSVLIDVNKAWDELAG